MLRSKGLVMAAALWGMWAKAFLIDWLNQPISMSSNWSVGKWQSLCQVLILLIYCDI